MCIRICISPYFRILWTLRKSNLTLKNGRHKIKNRHDEDRRLSHSSLVRNVRGKKEDWKIK